MKNRKIKLFENYSNSYTRVIPRDFFNEAKLLNCMGFLQLKILDQQTPPGINIEINGNGEPFKIELNEAFYGLYVINYQILVNDEPYIFLTRYNNKNKFPFFVVTEDDEEIEVFDEQRNFTEEFIDYFTDK